MLIATGVRASEPVVLLEEVLAHNPQATFLHSRTFTKKSYASGQRVVSTFLDSNVAGQAEYIPIHFSRIPQYFDSLDIDLAVLQVAYDEKLGYSFGTNPDYNAYLMKAKDVWVEVNRQMPWTYGPRFPIEKVTRTVQTDCALPECAYSLSDSEAKAYDSIRGFIEPFITEGCTLQVGVGKVQKAVQTAKAVSIYSEMIGDWVMPLNATRIVGSFAMGTSAFYRWLDRNPRVELRPIGDVANPLAFAAIDRMVSINSAVEVDLFGQAASESVHYRQLSGTGGSNDFTAGAAISKGGVSILAIPSLTKDGKSKIVPRLENLVTIPRADIDYVITEWGVATLRFKTVRERQRELIKVAHPSHREWLTSQMDKRNE